MRFFKSFNLLHRRTKSETFAPGFTLSTLGVTILNGRPSSLPTALSSSSAADISPVFDFATSTFTPVNANAYYWKLPNHTSTLRRNDFQNSLLVEENLRLREALNMWFSEYSRAEELLRKCHAELAVEREKVQTLLQQTTRDQEHILDLKNDLVRYEKKFDESKNLISSDHCCPYDSANVNLLSPGSSDPATSLVISKQTRTLDDYTSALRMTLSTRRELQDQKKVSKFWKNIALDTGKIYNVITPSISAISSIHEPLPPERKLAIDALMTKRGWPYPQRQSASSEPHTDTSEPFSNKDLSFSRIHPASSIAISLPSRDSVGSRLAPLASESLKTEINLLFGIQVSEKSSPSSKKYQPASMSVTSSETTGDSPSRSSSILKANKLAISFGSYGDLSRRFLDLFSQDATPNVKLPSTKKTGFTAPSPSGLAESSAPSGSSRIFSEALALLQGRHDSDVCFNIQSIDIDEKIKPHKSTLSWQKYVFPAPKKDLVKKETVKKKIFAGKENAGLSFKPKQPSGVQIPFVAKDYSSKM